jgi:hypothetical protein
VGARKKSFEISIMRSLITCRPLSSEITRMFISRKMIVCWVSCMGDMKFVQIIGRKSCKEGLGFDESIINKAVKTLL